MTDEKAENIPADNDDLPQQEDVVTRDPQSAPEVDAGADEDQQLSELMSASAGEASPAPIAPKVDLEQEAIEAAAQAVADGERAVAEAEAALREAAPPAPPPATGPLSAPRNRRELVLRVLLAVNVAVILVVALLPAPATGGGESVDPVVTEPPAPAPTSQVSPQPTAQVMNEPWNQALRASERREWGAAVTILEGYLDSRPEMPPSERLSVLSALSFYAARDKDFGRSRRYSQQAQALEQSHSLPADLVKEAAAAVELGDQESLRRIWARFLLQQRQIPSWLYQHVAQAYLELGDSYREDAASGARAARALELEAAVAAVRAEALEREEKR